MIGTCQTIAKSFSWKITENCNSRCVTCSHWQQHTTNELTLQEAKNLIDQCFENDVFRFRLTGGEPTLRRDLPEIVKHIQSRDGTVSINSNFILPKIPYDIHALMVPLDGLRLTYFMIRGVDKFNTVVENLQDFRKHSSAKLFILTPLLNENINEIPEILNLCRQLDAKLVINLPDTTPYFFNIPQGLQQLTYDDYLALSEQLLTFYDEDVFTAPEWMISQIPLFYSNLEKHIPCPLPKQGFRIDSIGNLYANCWSIKPTGNIRSRSVAEILKSKLHTLTVKKLCRHECPGCTCGWMIRLRHYHSDWMWLLRKFLRNLLRRK